MVAVSLVLVLALVSSTVVAQPGIKGLTSPLDYSKQKTILVPSETSTKLVYEWIPPRKWALKSTSNINSVKIGLKYILKKLKLQPDEFKIRNNFIDHLKITHVTDDEHIPVWKFQLRDNSITQWIEIKVNANTGNNVLTILEGGKTFEMATKGVFGGIFDPLLPPQTPKNIMAGAINAFYVANMVHDVFCTYGFTEPAGNFQEDNFKRGGIEEDPVIINIQKSDKQNGAYFNTPPDGQSGVLNLHIFTATNPNRDPALDNTLVIHELTHGLSSRLTGGARTKLCMAETESRGLSEGYSDIIALIFMAKPEDTRDTKTVMGEYVKGSPGGVRRYPYTTDMKVNPLAYQNAVGETNHYNLGEIWATMLLEVYWNFVEKYGFSANLHDATQKRGNIIFLQILVGTLMIQPCKLTFDSARDAMLAADYAYYGGIHKHLIRQGFAKRGLGSIS
ncbi:hypothetical protein BSLG_010714 [Batrachochytrium salamandrivorans]|nr:hypothetical protein BSLG_010714 [Batrachochytrium salamandrivorans]